MPKGQSKSQGKVAVSPEELPQELYLYSKRVRQGRYGGIRKELVQASDPKEAANARGVDVGLYRLVKTVHVVKTVSTSIVTDEKKSDNGKKK